MQPLNLPPYKYDIKMENDKIYIFDTIRKKYLINTPEEWVRQHFIQFLINHRNYSKNLISVETGLKYGNRRKRTDIQLFDNNGLLNILVECKAPDIALDQKVVNQILQYNKVLNPKIMAITNGIEHVFIEINESNFEYLPDMPYFKTKNDAD
jgi:hypothetical protein